MQGKFNAFLGAETFSRLKDPPTHVATFSSHVKLWKRLFRGKLATLIQRVHVISTKVLLTRKIVRFITKGIDISKTRIALR